MRYQLSSHDKLIAHGSWLTHAIRTKIPHKKAYNSLATHVMQLKSHVKSHFLMTTHATRTKFLRESSCTYAVLASKTNIS